MSKVLPILFNTDMVRAILDGRKTVTRRTVKYKYSNTEMKMHTDKYGTRLIEIQKDIEGETHGRNPDGSTWHKLLPYIEKNPPYRRGDILYVREAWSFLPCVECMDEGPACSIAPVVYDDGDVEAEGCFVYKASHPRPEKVSWEPSIHMPKQASRIWLKVIDVRVEQLQDITEEHAKSEGAIDSRGYIHSAGNEYDDIHSAKDHFKKIWDSTIRKLDIDRYGYEANPWVWVIEFERCGKPEMN